MSLDHRLHNRAASASKVASPLGVALVIGAGGSLGAALVAQLSRPEGESTPYPAVLALSRSSHPAIDYADEISLKTAAGWACPSVR